MLNSVHKDLFHAKSRHLGKQTRKATSRQNQFFHLPTVIAQNDPFIQNIYGVVELVLDDHPYPKTRDDFRRRTYEIEQNIRDLNLSKYQHRFLQDLMFETRVTLVRSF